MLKAKTAAATLLVDVAQRSYHRSTASCQEQCDSSTRPEFCGERNIREQQQSSWALPQLGVRESASTGSQRLFCVEVDTFLRHACRFPPHLQRTGAKTKTVTITLTPTLTQDRWTAWLLLPWEGSTPLSPSKRLQQAADTFIVACLCWRIRTGTQTSKGISIDCPTCKIFRKFH